MISDGMLHFTLTQADIADITGMTAVHTNRILQRLRTQKIIRLDTHRPVVLDPIRLAKLCDFPGHPGIEQGKWEQTLTGVKAA